MAAENARPGAIVKVWKRLAITSDQPAFHRIADGFVNTIHHYCQAAGVSVNVSRAAVILFVIRPDNTAELWMDTAAMCLNILTNRDVSAGAAVFEGDIVDVTAMAFPLVKIGKEDKVICLFREGWRFGLYFDFNPNKSLSVDEFSVPWEASTAI